MACPAETITAMIGPCIAQKSYEVSVGFEKPFLDNDEEAERFFMSGQVGKLHFDLAGYCAFRLQKAGINKVEINGIDTLTNTNFYSHRGGDGGRNLSAIKMRKK
jgi:copper oxidase (laccase) domain-containing protein